MSEDSGADFREAFPPTSGRIIGTLATLLCLATVVLALFDGEQGFGVAWAWGAAFCGILAYAALLRPGLRVEGGFLVMRNMLDTHRIPLASIEEAAVRQVLAVRAGDKRYISPVVGRTFLRTIRPRQGAGNPLDYPEYVRDRILSLADGAKSRLGDAAPPPATRTWAWPEIIGLVVTAVGTVISNLV